MPELDLAEVDALLAELLEQEEPERALLLASRCAGNPELRREVETLLRLSEEEITPLIEPIRAFVRSLEDHEELDELGLPTGEVVGAYRIVEKLGRGGMGMVYLAERVDGSFEKRVALKVLPHTGSRPALIRRFEQERQILARLEHPAIARLLDGGVDRRGLPFLVLEYVDGLPIDQHCDRRRLPISERIRLVIEAAQAVQSAHRNLVIHRDLKPSNILVTAEGQVKLLDFGIAKLIEPEAGEENLTRLDRLPMTPSYASPEQITGAAITTAADVYQLGLLLFELLTGHRPQQTTADSLSDLVKVVCHNEPPAASRVVTQPFAELSADELADRRSSTPAKLARLLRPELDAVLAQALHKVPERRYASAQSFAADLERFQSGLPVEAQRPTLGLRVGKWVKRNRGAAAALGLAALLTAGYALAVTVQARALAEERDRARLEAAKALEVERFVVGLFDSSRPFVSRGDDPRASELLERGVQRVEEELKGQPEVQARLSSMLGHVLALLGRYEEGLALQNRALTQRRSLRVGDHPELAESLVRLGMVQNELGRSRAALELFEEALAIYRRLRPESLEFVDTVSQVGRTLNALGEHQQALTLLTENLAARQRLGSEAAFAIGLSDIGNCHFSLGRYEEAADNFRQALSINRRIFGDQHTAVATNLGNLAHTLLGMNANAEAESIFAEGLVLREKIFGSDSVELAIHLTNHGRNQARLGRLEQAEASLGRALGILEAKVPADHPRFGPLFHGLGELRLLQGRLAEAESLLNKALTLQKQRHGQAPMVAFVLTSLGRLRLAQGRAEEARTFWLQALAISSGRHEFSEKRLRELLKG